MPYIKASEVGGPVNDQLYLLEDKGREPTSWNIDIYWHDAITAADD